MKNLILKLLFVAFLSFFTVSCDKDDDNKNQSYPQDVIGTTWYFQEIDTESGETIVVDVYLVFETSDTGYIEAYSDVANLTQTYDFTYSYSKGIGRAEFYDNNLGTVNFGVSGNQLVFDGETFTRQD